MDGMATPQGIRAPTADTRGVSGKAPKRRRRSTSREVLPFGGLAAPVETLRQAVPGAKGKYDREFAQLLIDHMARGGSAVAFAGRIGVSQRTLYNWIERHKDFRDAHGKGLTLAQAWWEELGQRGAQGLGPLLLAKRVVKDGVVVQEEFRAGAFNFLPWVSNMKNRFGYRDQVDHRHEGTLRLELTPAEKAWERRRKKLPEASGEVPAAPVEQERSKEGEPAIEAEFSEASE